MSTVKNYLSLVKFSHTIFAMPFALIGFVLGIAALKNNNIHLQTNEVVIRFCLVLVCMITARSAAMGFNRYLDRHFDQLNPRTAIREIPAGIIKAEKALGFVIANALIFIIATYFINPICFYLAPVALFVILFYSYTKRFTSLCHLVLGLGLSLSPIGAYLAVTGEFDVQLILVGGLLGVVTESIVGLLSNATLRLSRPNAVMVRLLTPILLLPWALVVDTLSA